MAAVAEGHVFGMLAGTPGDGFLFGNFHFPWLQPGPFVGAIAKGLTFGTPTSAPPIDSGFHQLDDGRFLKNYRLIHVCVYTEISRQARRAGGTAEIWRSGAATKLGAPELNHKEHRDHRERTEKRIFLETENEEFSHIVLPRGAETNAEHRTNKEKVPKTKVVFFREDSDYQGHSLSMLKRIAAAVNKRVEIRFLSQKRKLEAA